MSANATVDLDPAKPARQELDSAVVRFAGDSGDGMQLTGGQFTQSYIMLLCQLG